MAVHGKKSKHFVGHVMSVLIADNALKVDFLVKKNHFCKLDIKDCATVDICDIQLVPEQAIG